MAKAPVNGNLVRRTDTGATAWYVQAHQKGAHTVLPEGAQAAVMWEAEVDLEVIPGRKPPWRT